MGHNFTAGDVLTAEQLNELAYSAERLETVNDDNDLPPGGDDFSADEVFYGKPTAAFDNGSSLTLDPCDASGADNGETNVTANFRAEIDIQHATIDETPVAVTCEIPTTEVLPYVDVAGTFYILHKPPIQVLTEYQVETDNLELNTKVRFDFGLFVSTESDWVTVHTGDACVDATNGEILSLMEL